MHTDVFTTCLSDAREAVASFLTTLLGEEPTLEMSAPGPAPEAVPHAAGAASFVAHSADLQTTVLLAPEWVAVFSQAMLGEPLDADAPDAADVIRESVAQGYGAVQRAVSGHDVALPSVSFDVSAPGTAAFDALDTHIGIGFVCIAGGASLKGWIVFPDVIEAAAGNAQPEADSADRPDAPPAAERSSTSMTPPSYADLGAERLDANGTPGNFELLAEVELEVTVELGRRSLPLADVLQLTMGSVIELEKLVGEPLEVYANGRLIAEGEAVVIDEQFGVRITSLASARTQSKVFL